MDKQKEKLAPVLHFFAGMAERRLTVYSASCCYYLFMSLVPIVMILCCLLPYTPISEEYVLNAVDTYFSASLGIIVRRIVSAIYASSSATLTVSILMTLFSASASMKALIRGMNAAYDVKKLPGFFPLTLLSLLYMVLLIAALILSLFVMVYGEKIARLVIRLLPAFSVTGEVIMGIRFLAVMVLLSFFFLALYRVMPAEKGRWRDQIPGAVFSAVTWVGFSWVFALYVNISDKYGAYGVIGTIMVAMMWMYYILYFLLIGGYINSCLAAKRNNKGTE